MSRMITDKAVSDDRADLDMVLDMLDEDQEDADYYWMKLQILSLGRTAHDVAKERAKSGKSKRHYNTLFEHARDIEIDFMESFFEITIQSLYEKMKIDGEVIIPDELLSEFPKLGEKNKIGHRIELQFILTD